MDVNILKLGFAFMTSVIVVLGSLINVMEQHLPRLIAQTFRYGKFAYQGKPSVIKPIEVPKRWFRHFYVFAAINSTFATLLVFGTYITNRKKHDWLMFALDLLASSSRKANVSALSALLALCLLTIQSWHRFHETWFVSVFSNGKMSVSHYFIGYIHYFGSVAAILSEAPGFINNEVSSGQLLRASDVTFLNMFGCCIFLWACYHQCIIGIILANLRKNDKGQVVSYEHSVPRGDWFQMVSCPHLLAEVLMYFALTCILWGNSTWPWVFLWVLSNQVESALLAHWWYQSKFKEYPKERKAIIPYVL